MNFDNIIQKDLMTGLYRVIAFLLILLFWNWPYSIYYTIQWVIELRIHLVEDLSEVRQKSTVKIDVFKTKNVIKS